MKVVAINGSPHPNGNTYKSLQKILLPLEKEGIETDVLQIGSASISGCRGCGRCLKEGNCVYIEDCFTKYVRDIEEADGLVIGSPVYYGSMTGTLMSFLDRLCFQDRKKKNLRYKIGASIAVMRRSGGNTAIDDINRFMLLSEMIITPSVCPNIIFGAIPGEVELDREGMDTLDKISANMLWLLRIMDEVKGRIPPPAYNGRITMNFIR